MLILDLTHYSVHGPRQGRRGAESIPAGVRGGVHLDMTYSPPHRINHCTTAKLNSLLFFSCLFFNESPVFYILLLQTDLSSSQELVLFKI